MDDRALWAAATATFGVGDVLTTHYGLQLDGVREASPVGQQILGAGGSAGMVGMKVLLFVAAYLAYHHAPAEYRAGVPLGLALLGSWVVWHNATVIAEAGP